MAITFLNNIYLGNRLLDYIIFLAIIAISIVFGKVIYYITKNILKQLVKKSETLLDDIFVEAMDHPLVFLIFIIGLAIAYNTLTLNEATILFFKNLISILLIIDATWFLTAFLDQLIIHYVIPLSAKTDSDLDDALLPIIRKLVRWGIIIIAAIMILDKFGYNIASLVAGLGIGGIAIAMAAKDMLGNMFGGASIISDKPFKLGDRIKFADIDGKVQEVGIRSTKITTFDGTEIIVPNATIANSTLENVSREKERRIKFTIGLTYETSSTKLKKAATIIKKIVKNHKHTTNKVNVYFTEFADSSLNLTITYWINNLDAIFATKSEINFAIKKEFDKESLDMAFPSRTIYLREE
jgi:MscS family membrane protein